MAKSAKDRDKGKRAASPDKLAKTTREKDVELSEEELGKVSAGSGNKMISGYSLTGKQT